MGTRGSGFGFSFVWFGVECEGRGSEESGCRLYCGGGGGGGGGGGDGRG